MISNLQRFEYLLDTIAEPFPEKAKERNCGCDENITETPPWKTKRDLVEEAVVEAMPESWKTQGSLKDILKNKSDAEIAPLLSHVNIDTIDSHLQDLARFSNTGTGPEGTTTFSDIVGWDTRHEKL